MDKWMEERQAYYHEMSIQEKFEDEKVIRQKDAFGKEVEMNFY